MRRPGRRRGHGPRRRRRGGGPAREGVLQRGSAPPWRRMIRIGQAAPCDSGAGDGRGTFDARRASNSRCGGPAIAEQDAGKVRAERARRFRKAAAGFERVDRRVRASQKPRAEFMPADLPAGFIGSDHRTAADRGHTGRHRSARLARRPMDGVDQAAAGDGQAEAVAEQDHDRAERKAGTVSCGSRRARSPAAPAARPRRPAHRRFAAGGGPARADGTGDTRRWRRETRAPPGVGWAGLPGTARRHGGARRAPAVRTLRRQRRVVRHIDVRRRARCARAAIQRARFAARPLGMLFRQAAREGRRLPIRAAARHLEFFFQPLVLAPQAVAFDLRPLQVLFESRDAPRLIVDDLAGLSGRRILGTPRHVSVMPDSQIKYKLNMRTTRGDPLNRYAGSW